MGAGWTYRRRRIADAPEVLASNFQVGSLYEIEDVDTDLIKLFALSLLWRAAASKLEAFEGVCLRPDFLEHLRHRVCAGIAGKPADIPVYFSLFDDEFELSKMAPTQMARHPFYRFFLDGIVCYVAKGRTNLWSKKISSLLVGARPGRVAALCISSQHSEHAAYERRLIRSLADAHGDVFHGEYDRPYLRR